MDKKVKNIRILKRISKTIFFNAIGEHYSVELIIKLYIFLKEVKDKKCL